LFTVLLQLFEDEDLAIELFLFHTSSFLIFLCILHSPDFRLVISITSAILLYKPLPLWDDVFFTEKSKSKQSSGGFEEENSRAKKKEKMGMGRR
jgi:hypothetical protein